MCRIALGVNVPGGMMETLGALQANGATVGYESWQNSWFCMIQNRFSVTSKQLSHGSFPLSGERYVIAYDGEVYQCHGRRFIDERHYQSDVHFALAMIEKYGINHFFRDVDFEGTIQIYDKLENLLHIFVDQLNTHGCFYAFYDDKFIMASEASVVHQGLELLAASGDVPIWLLEGGGALTILPEGKVIRTNYRPDREKVWGGDEDSPEHFKQKVRELKEALISSTLARIPAEGDVGVLAGGGVDSSLVLATVASLLRENGQLDRLRIFTLGSPHLNICSEHNDFNYILLLCKELNLDWQKYVRVISPSEIEAGVDFLLREKVYSEKPRLITPNPVRTQVRHTVMMANVLAAIVLQQSELQVLLTGDAADEIFAGYNSMHWGITRGSELRQRILEKLFDLPLNDAGRVALASYHGTAALLKHFVIKPELQKIHKDSIDFNSLNANLESKAALEIQEELKQLGVQEDWLLRMAEMIHPVEVRMPYTSHHILRVLADAPINYTIGFFGGKLFSKFLLRILALDSGIPKDIAFRKKIPFNEGGRGIRNADQDPVEAEIATNFLNLSEVFESAKETQQSLFRLGIIDCSDEYDQEFVTNHIVHFALLHASRQCGIRRLLKGNAFRDQMPDTIYSTTGEVLDYTPTFPLECEISADNSAYSISILDNQRLL